MATRGFRLEVCNTGSILVKFYSRTESKGEQIEPIEDESATVFAVHLCLTDRGQPSHVGESTQHAAGAVKHGQVSQRSRPEA